MAEAFVGGIHAVAHHAGALAVAVGAQERNHGVDDRRLDTGRLGLAFGGGARVGLQLLFGNLGRFDLQDIVWHEVFSSL